MNERSITDYPGGRVLAALIVITIILSLIFACWLASTQQDYIIAKGHYASRNWPDAWQWNTGNEEDDYKAITIKRDLLTFGLIASIATCIVCTYVLFAYKRKAALGDKKIDEPQKIVNIPQPSAAFRLKELDGLLSENLITRDEYEARRQSIINNI